MTMKRLLAVAFLATALVAAGCGDGDSASEPDTTVEPGNDQGTAPPGTIDDGDGSSGGGASPPDTGDIGVPLPPGADAVATSESGSLTIVQFIVPLDQQQSTIEFYDNWTESQPDEYQRVAAESGGVSWQNSPEVGADKTVIAVLAPLEGDDFVAVTVTTGPLE